MEKLRIDQINRFFDKLFHELNSIKSNEIIVKKYDKRKISISLTNLEQSKLWFNNSIK